MLSEPKVGTMSLSMRPLISFERPLVIAKHGGAEVAHRNLDRMAMQLARCEATLERLRGDRLVRALMPLYGWYRRRKPAPDVAVSRWLKDEL